ncbi:MAG: serine/threonine-protein kinase [Nannocystaceae bacterium]
MESAKSQSVVDLSSSKGLADTRISMARGPDGSLESRVAKAALAARLDVADAPARPTMGRFQLLRRIGSGAMGVVYEAYDRDLDRRVALKVLRPEVAARSGLAARSRMLREAQALARLRHPNVTMVYEVGSGEGDSLFIAMELVEGRTLQRWLRARGRSWREIIEVFAQAGRGLSAAHRAGLVHRDFKPDNVIVDDEGQARVVDFGLARSAGLGELLPTLDDAGASAVGMELTCTGAVLGTPAYMAPEQFGGRTVRPASDQFSFCVALFEALYGRRPFPGNDLPSLQRSLLSGKPLGPRRGVPRALHRVLRRGLALEPRDRYRSMEALLDALAACTRRAPSRRSMVLVLGLAAAAGLGAIVPRSAAPVVEQADCRPSESERPTPARDRLAIAPARVGAER